MVSVNCQLDKIETHLGDGFWTCLWDIMLVVLIKVSRPSLHGWYHSPAGILDNKSCGATELIFVLCFCEHNVTSYLSLLF